MAAPDTTITPSYQQPYYASSLYGETVYGLLLFPPPSQAVGWPAFFQSISNHIIATNSFGPGGVFWAIDPDSVIQWPQCPPPFALLVPRAIPSRDEDIGGGRFTKTWDFHLDVHIVVSNVYDQSFQDTEVVTSADLVGGPYALGSLVIDKLEQAYIKTPTGDFSTVEFPRSTGFQEIHRFAHTNAYISVPISFEMVVWQQLLSTWLPVATPPSQEDIDAFSDPIIASITFR